MDIIQRQNESYILIPKLKSLQAIFNLNEVSFNSNFESLLNPSFLNFLPYYIKTPNPYHDIPLHHLYKLNNELARCDKIL